MKPTKKPVSIRLSPMQIEKLEDAVVYARHKFKDNSSKSSVIGWLIDCFYLEYQEEIEKLK